MDEESPVRPRRRGRRRKEEPEIEAGEGLAAPANGNGDAELAADELPEGAPRGEATPIDEEMLEAIRREVAADRTSEDELFELAASLPQEEDEAVEDEAWLAAGPVFDGPVPLDTPEQRQFAMEKAGARLGITTLYPEQHEVLDASLRGEDVLMVLPTGFGKSACYQIPSMILPKPVLVISPLLALMRDQYEKLQRRSVPCVKLDGTVRGKARAEALAQIAKGERVLVMTTPETLGAPDAMAALAKGGISLAAVDEAHCISEWGYDFRPAYLQIGERLKLLGAPPVLALTATATEKVRLAIQRFVGMRKPRIVATSPHRSNLAFDVLHCSSGARLRALVRLALRVRRPGIIYCSTTRDVDEIYTVLQRFGVPSYRYHGKMNPAERSKSQDGFMARGRRTVMVATNAFGLGIDKSDIRYVMHYQSPASLEQYVQEAGRGGRDGRRANCIMLYSGDDRAIHEALLSRSRVRPEQLFRLGSALAAWAAEEKVPSVAALALSAELGSRTTTALLALLEEAELVKWDVNEVHVVVPADRDRGALARARRPVRDAAHAGRAPARRGVRVRARPRLPRDVPARVLRRGAGRALRHVRPLPRPGRPPEQLLGAAGAAEGRGAPARAARAQRARWTQRRAEQRPRRRPRQRPAAARRTQSPSRPAARAAAGAGARPRRPAARGQRGAAAVRDAGAGRRRRPAPARTAPRAKARRPRAARTARAARRLLAGVAEHARAALRQPDRVAPAHPRDAARGCASPSEAAATSREARSPRRSRLRSAGTRLALRTPVGSFRRPWRNES